MVHPVKEDLGMSDRQQDIADFLAQTDWADARRDPLAGDASNRRYERLRRADGASAVLMDAPADRGEDVRPFMRIAKYLRDAGLSAPIIYAKDEARGLLLLEDLGDDLFARVLSKRPELETDLYETATDVLIALHQMKLPDLAPYDTALMTQLAALAFDWYEPYASGRTNTAARAAFEAQFAQTLDRVVPRPSVLVQRDYHAENLLWLPDRVGVARVGLLDFQDAVVGHPAYDLVSLLQDARRDVSPEIEATMIDRYIRETQCDAAPFGVAYAALGVQRSLRILGVFTRLCVRDGKAHYVDFIPRVWGCLVRDLQHPALAHLAPFILNAMPSPTIDVLKRLKDKCATHPKP